MAMSFSRPDPSAPASVADATFATSRRGFDQHEVRDFLRMVAAELGRLQERERFLERELRTAQTNPDLSSVHLDDEALTRLLGEETARVLTTARESANEIRQKAEQSAAQLLNEAGDEAARLREEAEIESSRRRSDAASDAEAELAMAKQQGREMVNEARAYRERVLSELARRRELAREQIEQLLHGRDRLVQSFERARLAAVDVINELQPLGEPDEYVNLAPTTGPVPVMLPNTPRPTEAASPPDTTATTPDADATGDGAEIVDAPEPGDAADPADAEVASEVAADPARAGTDDDAAAATEHEPVVETADDATDDVTEETTDDAAEEATDDTPDPTEPERGGDDVVVDLFARLRADTTDTGADTAADADVRDDAPAAGADVADAPDGDDPSDTFAQRDAALTPLIVASARRVKRVLADEQNEVLDVLRRKEPVTDIAVLVPSGSEHLARYRTAIAGELLAAANAGAAAMGRATPLRKADGDAAIRAAGGVLDEWVTVPLRERLERCISEGSGDNADITKRIRSVYREWKTQHIDEQLDEVVHAAYGRGAYAAIGRGTPVVWVTAPDRQVCADCNDNTLAGVLAAGDEFPTGHVHAPAHHGCRCQLQRADH